MEDLKPHLYSLPEHPDWIPYRTSYYKEQWGFCLAHNDLLTMGDGEYEVLVDSTLKDGHLTYGEYFIQGKARDEVLVSSHICHPSLANDNLAGVALSTFFAQFLEKTRPAYSWRFLFIPGTIGAITWLALNPDVIPRIKHGLVLSGGGDSGEFTYKKSRRGNAQVDRIMAYVLGRLLGECKVEEFSPYGYDERQYCSPGFNLPVGRLSRTPFGQYPQYHTSADNLDFVKPQNLVETYSILLAFHQVLEGNRTLLNTNPKCEPQLGRRGIYETIGGSLDAETEKMAILWVLNLSDGEHSLLDIAERSGLNFMCILKTAEILEKSGLLTVK